MAALTNFTGDEHQNVGLEQFCLEVFSVKLYGQLIFLAVVNMFLSISAFLGNTLILVALHRESSLRPPFASKYLYRNLAITHLCVGILVEPTYIAYLMSLMDKRFDICHYSRVTCFFITFVFCAVSFLTSSAITVDRLIVILLRLKYRHVATSFKGKVIIVVVLWILGIFGASRYFWNRLSKEWLWERALWVLFLATSIISFIKIFFSLRRNQIHAQNGVSQEQTSRIIPLYRVAWYRKSVCSAFWVQLTLVACYLPLTVVEALTPQRGPVPISLYLATEFTVTLVYLNSSLNPLLYSWRIPGVKQAVKIIIRQLLCSST